MNRSHGRVRMYCQHKCRCDDCRAAYSAYQREYYQRNEEKYLGYRDRCREQTKAYLEIYRSKPKGKQKARKYSQTRRARKLDQFIENVESATVYQMHGGMCGICKDFVSEEDFHIDHITPLSKGGMHGYINVQPAHPACNLKKNNKE